MKISCIIPCRTLEDPLLKDLLKSIDNQTYSKEKIEIITVTEGDSEQAKAIGIRKATGDILCMLCTDNYFVDETIFEGVVELFKTYEGLTGIYSKFYHYHPKDHSLNRYFALLGVNDPIPFYLGKADRRPYWELNQDEVMSFMEFTTKIPSLGDNGFFIRTSFFKATNLDHYYPMDNCEDMRAQGMNSYLRLADPYIWHRTADNFITFLRKRYRYARDLYCERYDRRWKMLDTREDYMRLGFFVLATIFILPALLVSTRGFLKIRDWAWFWHWPVCFGTLITYGLLACRNFFRHRSLFQRLAELKVSSLH